MADIIREHTPAAARTGTQQFTVWKNIYPMANFRQMAESAPILQSWPGRLRGGGGVGPLQQNQGPLHGAVRHREARDQVI